MSSGSLEDRLNELRSEFDRTFAEPLTSVQDGEDLLALRAGDAELAIRIRETAGIQRCPVLTLVPSRSPALCGLAGVRGRLVAVFDLGSLVCGQTVRQGGWILLCAADPSVALRFDGLDGYERLGTQEIDSSVAPAAGDSEALSRLVLLSGRRRALLTVPSLLGMVDRIGRQGGARIEDERTDEE
jgi:chemotaxis signal transduction protein